jgi:hypothetical protein
MKIRIVRTFLESELWKMKAWEATRPEDPLSNEDQIPKLTDAEILTSDGKIYIITKEERWNGSRVDDKLGADSSNFESREFMEMANEHLACEYCFSPPEISAKTLKEAVYQIRRDAIYKAKFNVVWKLN